MPFIQCHIKSGLSEARKRQLVRDIVDVTREAIGSDPKIINVLLHEHPDVNMCISGRVPSEAELASADGSTFGSMHGAVAV